MKQWSWLLFCLFFHSKFFAEEVITHAALQGAWTYFHISHDSFAPEKIVATEQRLLFRDGHNVTLEIFAKEAEYTQTTTYNLKYTLSFRDNVTYLSLFSTESDKRIGAYVRMVLSDSLEMAGDPGFRSQKRLYRRTSLPISIPAAISNSADTNSNKK